MSNIIRHGRFLLLTLLVSALILPGVAVAQNPEPGASEGEGSEGEKPNIVELGPGEEAVSDEIIVKYKRDVGPDTQDEIRREEGLEKKEDLNLIDAEVVEVEGQPLEETINNLQSNPDIEYAEPNHIFRANDYSGEPRFDELWGLHNKGQTIKDSVGTTDVDVNAPEASDITQGDEDLVVAVIDDGVDFSHPDLKGREWKNPGESGDGKETNGVDDDGNDKIDDVNGWDFEARNNTIHDPLDDHGTHVAGTIAASVNGQGVVGVAPNVKIMALKFLDATPTGEKSVGTAEDAILAIEYAVEKGAKISNNSWGGDPYNQALKDAIDKAGTEGGMLFVASASNEGEDNDTDSTPNYPASYDSPNILSVAALNNQGNLAGFSSYGATSVDISAPGVSVLSSFPAAPAWPGVALSSVGSSSKALIAGFGIEEINGSASRQSFMQQALAAVGRGNQQVVLVDDDASNIGFPDVGPTLSAAIQSATGTAPEVIPVRYRQNGPDLSRLQGKTVVWATGQVNRSNDNGIVITERTLTATDRRTLTDFLDPDLNPSGGKLILTGMDALHLNEDTAFVRRLGVDVLRDVTSTKFNGNVSLTGLDGASGTEFNGLSYSLTNSGFARPQRHDFVVPDETTAATQVSYNVAATPATWQYSSGTSMAAPHATGTATLAASLNPALLGDPAALKSAVMDGGKQASATSGKTVTGDMVDAFGALREADKAPPEGTVLINDGARKTKIAGVTLTLSASDPEPGSGVGWVRFRNEDGDWSDWEPYEPNKEWEWTLSDGKRDKTVYVQFKDRVGNESAVVRDTIRKISSH